MSNSTHITIDVTPTLGSAASATGRQMMSSALRISSVFQSAQAGSDTMRVHSTQVIDNDELNKSFDIMLFNQDPSPSSTANQTLSLSTSGMASLIGTIRVSANKYVDFGAQSVVRDEEQNPGLDRGPASSGKDIWMLLVSRTDSSINLSTNGLNIKMTFLRS